MRPFLLLLSLAVCNTALAQTPSANMMPDGSRDMYVGVGIESAPRYEGSNDQRTQAVPALQVQWSNGIFVSGLSAGMHLSSTPGIEFGPLLAIEPGRRDTSLQALYVSNVDVATNVGAGSYAYAQVQEVGPRPEAGGFFNFYLFDNARIATSVLYGSGENRNGLIAQADLQRSFRPAPHHTLSFVAGFNWANKEYMQSYFGVPPNSIAMTSSGAYAYLQDGFEPGADFKDTHLSLHWNWEWSSSWILTSNVAATRLEGDAAASPLTTRRDNVTVSSAIAYRF
jgi:outer membrane scaffolding protein for murein synthesis (MipA/OmpV family)